MSETWRPVLGYEGSYEVSDLGRVRSLDRMSSHGRRLRGRVLTALQGSGGYLQVGLHRDGEQRSALVHRLVLTSFIGPAPDGCETLHGDGDRSNNALANLKWGTRTENAQDRLRHGTNTNAAKTHCPAGHPYSGDNLYVEPCGTRRCRECKRSVLARWKAEHPERFRDIQRRANRKYDMKRREGKAA